MNYLITCPECSSTTLFSTRGAEMLLNENRVKTFLWDCPVCGHEIAAEKLSSLQARHGRALTLELEGKTSNVVTFKKKQAWSALTDRGIHEGKTKGPDGDVIEIKIIRYYDPEVRDYQREALRVEPSVIDAALETVNAVTDLIE